jgi:hypothetical protein
MSPTLACTQIAGSAAQALAVWHLQLLPDQTQQGARKILQPTGMLLKSGLLLFMMLIGRLGAYNPACTVRHVAVPRTHCRIYFRCVSACQLIFGRMNYSLKLALGTDPACIENK